MVQAVYQIDWEESERHWGTRPDGHSLHATLAEAEKYVEDYWAGMPDKAPDEYERPCGKARLVEVDDETFREVEKRRNIRTYR